MGLAGCFKFVKVLLIVFNFIFWLTGCLLLGVALWLRFGDLKQVFAAKEMPPMFFAAVYVLMAAGAVIFIVSFLGCCGAAMENQCMLGTFFFLLLILFAAEVSAALWIFLQMEDLHAKTTQHSTNLLKNNNSDSLAIIHQLLDCCSSSGVPARYLCSSSIRNNTCEEVLPEFIQAKMYIGGGLSLGIACIMVIGMVLSMMLCCTVRHSPDVY
uniref:CD9 antigen-like isoform X2 n=1 Tax=Myxine glutinosa TaxID=7769 RepID=UPI00359019D3